MVLPALKDIAVQIMLESAKNTNDGFEARIVKIQENKGNVDAIVVSPANYKHKKIIVNLFKRESEVVLLAATEEGYKLCQTVEEVCRGKMPGLFFEASKSLT